MKTAVIALKNTEDLPDPADAYYIGADAGALALLQRGIDPDLAVGDFDSVSPGEREAIYARSKEVIQLKPIKDDADSEHAVKEALQRGFERIWLCGALGGRADHSLVNLRLCAQYPDILYIYDHQNLICAHTPGTYTIPHEEHGYVSFFTLTEARISLEGFFYPLQHRDLTPLDTYTVSNEVTDREGTLIIEEGTVLIMCTRDQ